MAAPTDLLANERTFLAYVRTALSLQLAGLAVFQFLDVAHRVVRPLLGSTLVGIGSYVAVAGYLRYRDNDARIRSNTEITSPASPQVIALVVFAVPLVAAVVIVLTV
jgi:putative membrane protein